MKQGGLIWPPCIIHLESKSIPLSVDIKMRRRVWDYVKVITVRDDVIVRCCMRHDLRNTMQMCCRVRHHVKVIAVRH